MPDQKEEDLANHFARYILAPTCLVMKYVDRSPFDVASIFDISIEASTNALCAASNRIDYFGKRLLKIEQEFLSQVKKK